MIPAATTKLPYTNLDGEECFDEGDVEEEERNEEEEEG